MCFLPQFTGATGIITLESVIFPMRFCVHSFIPDIYIAPLQETYSEVLSVQLRSKRNVLRSLQKEDMLFRGSKRSVRGSSFQVEGPITEKALRCLSAPCPATVKEKCLKKPITVSGSLLHS